MIPIQICFDWFAQYDYSHRLQDSGACSCFMLVIEKLAKEFLDIGLRLLNFKDFGRADIFVLVCPMSYLIDIYADASNLSSNRTGVC